MNLQQPLSFKGWETPTDIGPVDSFAQVKDPILREEDRAVDLRDALWCGNPLFIDVEALSWGDCTLLLGWGVHGTRKQEGVLRCIRVP